MWTQVSLKPATCYCKYQTELYLCWCLATIVDHLPQMKITFWHLIFFNYVLFL